MKKLENDDGNSLGEAGLPLDPDDLPLPRVPGLEGVGLDYINQELGLPRFKGERPLLIKKREDMTEAERIKIAHENGWG